MLTAGAPDTFVPLKVINTDDYAALSVPALSSENPSRLYYQLTVPNGTLWPWPFPTNAANQLQLFMRNQLAAFADSATTVNLPPGYEEAITLILEGAILRGFGKTISADLREEIQEARAAIQGVNLAPPKLSTDAPVGTGAGRVSNILTGGRA